VSEGIVNVPSTVQVLEEESQEELPPNIEGRPSHQGWSLVAASADCINETGDDDNGARKNPTVIVELTITRIIIPRTLGSLVIFESKL
jgi:hypothetical protein